MCKMKSVQVPTPGIDDTSKLIGRDWLSTLVLTAFGYKYSVARQLGLIVAVYLESPYRCWLFLRNDMPYRLIQVNHK